MKPKSTREGENIVLLGGGVPLMFDFAFVFNYAKLCSCCLI